MRWRRCRLLGGGGGGGSKEKVNNNKEKEREECDGMGSPACPSII